MEEATLPDALRRQGHDRAPPRRVPRVADHGRPRQGEREDRLRHATPSSTRCSATAACHRRPAPRRRDTDETWEIEADGVFVAIGHDPNTALFLDQLDHDEAGYLITKPGIDRDEHPGRLRGRRRPGPRLPPGRHRRRLRLYGRARRRALPRRHRGTPDGGRGRAARLADRALASAVWPKWIDLLDPSEEELARTCAGRLRAPSARAAALAPPIRRRAAAALRGARRLRLRASSSPQSLVAERGPHLLPGDRPRLTREQIVTVRKTPPDEERLRPQAGARTSARTSDDLRPGHDRCTTSSTTSPSATSTCVDGLDDEIDELEEHLDDWPSERVRRRLSRTATRPAAHPPHALADPRRRARDRRRPHRHRPRNVRREIFPDEVEHRFSATLRQAAARDRGARLRPRPARSGPRLPRRPRSRQSRTRSIKRLTVIASLLLFPTFIVGVYGQNFDHMPELHWCSATSSRGADRRHDRRAARLLPLEEVDLDTVATLALSALLHLPELQAALDRPRRPAGMIDNVAGRVRALRLRLPVRADGRLLPGAEHRLRRLRPRGTDPRGRPGRLRAGRLPRAGAARHATSSSASA